MIVLHEILRAETRIDHEHLMKALDLTRLTLTRFDYIDLLQKMYGIHFPIENQISQKPEWDVSALQLSQRCKVPLIIKDLIMLGVSPLDLRSLPLCHRIPSLSSFEEMLGCLYVLEGSTLGGQVLLQHFQKRFQLGSEEGCSYYSGYGTHTRKMWLQFLDFLNEQGSSNTIDSAKVIGAAKQTFQAIEEWLTPMGQVSQ